MYPTTVFTVRCTKKLPARLAASPALGDVEPTTRLGDWYANLLFRPGGQVVLFVNERTLLPVLVKAAPASTLVTRFPAGVAKLLLRLGAPAAALELEHREMAEVRLARSTSRQVLGSMNDFAYLLDAHREAPLSLSDAAMKLASAPCGPIGMKRPADVALEMLAMCGRAAPSATCAGSDALGWRVTCSGRACLDGSALWPGEPTSDESHSEEDQRHEEEEMNGCGGDVERHHCDEPGAQHEKRQQE